MRAQTSPFSLGVWGSAFAASLDEIFLKMAGSGLGFLDWHRGSVNITGEDGDPEPPVRPLSSCRTLAEAWRMKRGQRETWLSLGFREVLRR